MYADGQIPKLIGVFEMLKSKSLSKGMVMIKTLFTKITFLRKPIIY